MNRMGSVGVALTTLVLISGCATDQDESEPPAAADTEAPEHVDTETASAAASEGWPAGAGQFDSPLIVESFESLIQHSEEAGLECGDVSDGVQDTHSVRVCDSTTLLAYFDDQSILDSYANRYLDRGQALIKGDVWFVTGTPELIDTLLNGFNVE